MSGKLPRVDVKPVIRLLHLVAIHDVLLEDTIAVAQAVAPRREVETRQTVQEASRQPAQASISQGSIVLLVNDVLNTEAQVRESGLRNILLADIQHGVVESPAHEELEGEVVDTLAVGKGLPLLRPIPFQDEAVAEGQCRGGVGGRLIAIEHTAGKGRLDVLDDLGLEAVLLLEALGAVFGPCLALWLRNGGYEKREIVSASCFARHRFVDSHIGMKCINRRL